jgi:hypothetical protein
MRGALPLLGRLVEMLGLLPPPPVEPAPEPPPTDGPPPPVIGRVEPESTLAV